MSERILITAALPYTNATPHLGNLIGSVLSADVYARYCRKFSGKQVLFVCGTDDYGTTSEIKAWQEGKTPKEVCDHYRAMHREVYDWFGVRFDEFGQSSNEKHAEICQDIFRRLYESGHLVEKTVEQRWCDKCQRFLADRFIEGSCPTCLYQDARGDQCDRCQRLLTPAELLAPRCKLCGLSPEKKNSEHLFLDLPALDPALRRWLSSRGNWTNNARAITDGWLKQGLEPRCITRDLTWGVPVPIEPFESKVMYCWFEAPIAYMSITACHTPDWRSWWQDPTGTKLVQFMGKDNVPFHTIVFPASLLGSGERYTLLSDLSATEYLTYEGEKFSKSRGVGVFGTDARETGIPADCWRYYLLSIRPEASDADFSWTHFQARINKELVANLGNFVHRVFSFLSSRYRGEQPAESVCAETSEKIERLTVAYRAAMDEISLREGLRLAMDLAHLGNCYLQAEQPWKSFDSDRPRCDQTMATCLLIVRRLAELLEPFMPSVSVDILRRPDRPLFQVVTDQRVAELRAKYSGKTI